MTLRAARITAGLTQAELADRAGVTRQLVSAVEANRNEPGVRAGVALARALGTTVEALFANEQTVSPMSVIPGVIPDGPAHLGIVGNRTVVAAVSRDAVLGGAVTNAQTTAGISRLLPGAEPSGLVVAGCEPAIGLAAAGLSNRRSTMAVHTSSLVAINALAAGTIHAATVHGRRNRLPPRPVGVAAFTLATWRTGVGLRAGVARSLSELIERRITVIQRDPSAESQQAFARATKQLGGTPVASIVAAGHLEAARRVAFGADAAVTNEPSALAHGLTFLPAETHVVQLWVPDEYLTDRAVRELLDLLTTAAFQARLAAIGGYDLTGCGDRVAA